MNIDPPMVVATCTRLRSRAEDAHRVAAEVQGLPAVSTPAGAFGAALTRGVPALATAAAGHARLLEQTARDVERYCHEVIEVDAESGHAFGGPEGQLGGAQLGMGGGVAPPPEARKRAVAGAGEGR